MNIMTRLAGLLVMGALVLSACGSASESSTTATTDELTGTVAISGAFALYPMMTVWTEEFSKIHPNVQFDVQGGGSGKGMTDVLSGAVDIGMISREINAAETAKGAYWVAVTKDAVFPLISAKNPYASEILAKGMSQATFAKIFVTGEIKTWGEVIGKPEITDEIHVYTRSDAGGAGEMWAKFVGGKVQDDIKGIGVNGEPALVDTVIKDALGIGYSNLNSVFDVRGGTLVPDALVPPIDVNDNGQADANELYKTPADAIKAVADGVYPSPPARFENIATNGKPTGVTLAFITWMLTDGQQFLSQAGYVPLTPAQQTQSLDKLK